MNDFFYKIFFISVNILLFGTCLSTDANPPCLPRNPSFLETLVGKVILNDASTHCGFSLVDLPSPEILNLKNNGILRTNRILGSASRDVEFVELSIDNGPWNRVEGTSDWNYFLPTGDSSLRIHTYHTFTIRNKIYGRYSDPKTIRFQVGNNTDLNGDGLGDFAIGGPNASSNSGRVLVFYGKKEKYQSGNESLANANISGSIAGRRFGQSLHITDIDRDGYGDLVIGSSQVTPPLEGGVRIFYGKQDFLISSNDTASDTLITGNSGEGFGFSISSGDINGDGFIDLIIGAPAFNGNRGKVNIFYGIGLKLQNTTQANASVSINGTFTSQRLGEAVHSNDFNGDGISDLVLSARDFDNPSTPGNFEGQIFILFGKSENYPNAINDVDIGSRIQSSSASRFGTGFASGDLNQDGISDLLVDAPGFNTSPADARGQGHLYLGNRNGIPSGDKDQLDATLFNSNTLSQFFRSTYIQDFDGDGNLDIFTGANTEDTGIKEGAVYLFKGRQGGFPELVEKDSAELKILGNSNIPGANIGLSTTMVDLNGDGLSELIFSANTISTVFIYYAGNPFLGELRTSNVDARIQSTNVNDGLSNLSR